MSGRKPDGCDRTGFLIFERKYRSLADNYIKLNILAYLGYNVFKLYELYILYRGVFMCDVKEYMELYQQIKRLQPEDTMQLVLEAETEEQRNFFEMVGDFLLQQKQRQVIERNLF